MVVQLSVLGYILVPIFVYDKWWLVLIYAVFMLMVASLEAVQRPSYTFQVRRVHHHRAPLTP
jgi:ABC-type iron transport system FetAB permease component